MAWRAVSALTILCSVVVPAQQQGQDPNLYSLEKEKALGAGIAADVRRRHPVVEDEVLRGYLTLLLDRLNTQAASPVPVTVEIIASGKPRREPIALPGGFLFVPLGMLAAAESETDFATALAHGLAHIVKRHGMRAATQQGQTIPLIFMGGWHPDEDQLIPTGFQKDQREYEAEARRLAAEWTARISLETGQFATAKQRAASKPPSLRRP